MTANLREELAAKQDQLDLIAAIDHIRDHEATPSAMLGALVNLLAERFKSDLCLLSLIHRDTGDLELKASHDRSQISAKTDSDSLRELALRALKLGGIEIWQAEKVGLGALPEKTEVAAIPIIMRAGMRLGSALLVRIGSPFSTEERALMQIAEDHIDSAIVQGYVYADLETRNKELETIYRVDQIRDKEIGFDEMLNAVLHELRQAIDAEMGFIMLYDRAGDKLEMRSVTHDDLFRLDEYQKVVERVASDALHKAHLVFENDLEGAVNSMMCVPLILREEILGVFGIVNRYGPRGFNERDLRLMKAIASQIDTAIFESLAQRRLRQVLGRSVDPRVMTRLLDNYDVAVLKGERMTLSVLFADIRGSTALAEKTEPELLVGIHQHLFGPDGGGDSRTPGDIR